MYLTITELIEILKLSKATIYRKIKANEFPKPVKQGKFSYWAESDINRWIEKLKG
ncbi:prophage regulatory protein [Lebetimonas natsushimae]|uniref:Prophage regulatory protein n=1 Tax=Lebetimonas natsushimae TaxID=1936991 RepID=A0A292YBZ9_9BACT|nr:helix-turn-helix domain-containing protein [Lebetimonas natsushimae]GAX87033.1 prophage regulatory protein [Lebetimonas natsushimae]